MSEPRDEFAERAVLGHVLHAATVEPELRKALNPDDLWHPAHRLVAEAAWDLAARNLPTDPVSLRRELLRRGGRGPETDGAWLVDLMASAQPGVLHHVRVVRDMAVRRHVITAAGRASQQAENPGLDPYEIAASLYVEAETLAERGDPERAHRLTDVHTFIDGDVDYNWLVPGLLERGDRLLITAGEGAGKSVMTRQIAVTVAAGVHPFTGDRFEPARVLLVDLENGERMLRRALRPLLAHAHSIGRAVPPARLSIESRPSGIDLTWPADEMWLSRVCAAAQPDLLVIGPLYRMHATDMAKEEPARHLTRVLDTLRARHGCAVVVETHSPHANGPGQRNLRPVGSSLFMRWPEFGYGIAPSEEDSIYDFKTWRGPRDERQWPTQLRWGSSTEWPWVPFRRFAMHGATGQGWEEGA
jgi:hypothetical protein